jgi:hypothetical protein
MILPVKYMPGAERYCRKLRDKQLKSVCKVAIYRIRENPHIGNAKTGDLRLKKLRIGIQDFAAG